MTVIPVTKPLDLPLLEAELQTAGVPVSGLGITGDFLHTYDEDGAAVELPPAAVPVVEAHEVPPPPIKKTDTLTVEQDVRTTDDVNLEVFRFPTTPKQVYKAVFEMMAVDAVSGATRNTEARMTFKRTQAALVQVGTTSVPYNAPDTATTAWAIVPTVDGTDLVISVKGAAGRTIDWMLVGTIGVYAPEGLT